MIKLPEKPSDLILLAVNDLEACEQSDDYHIDMGDWHVPHEKCCVCFAGSVMAQSLKGVIASNLGPQNFGDYNQIRLRALDRFREGYIEAGLERMGFGDQVFDGRDAITYEHYPTKFKQQMRQLASDLAAEGL